MRILVPTNDQNENSGVCASFGRAPYYMIYDDEKDVKEFISNDAANSQGGAGIRAAQFIVDQNVDVVLASRCGENAANVLLSANLKMYKTISESIMESITAFKNDQLESLSDIHAGYHSHRGR